MFEKVCGLKKDFFLVVINRIPLHYTNLAPDCYTLRLGTCKNPSHNSVQHNIFENNIRVTNIFHTVPIIKS